MTRKLYTGQQVDVSFDSDMCTHSGVCVQGMPEVFNLDARPWINSDAAPTGRQLVDHVGRCPSGALRIERAEL